MTGSPLEQSFSIQEVCAAWGLSDRALAQLVRDGKVGHYRGVKRSIRFMPEHIAQLRALLEVKPAEAPVRIGTRRSVPRRRRSA